MCTIPVLRGLCRECYNSPEAVYATLKRRGMDLVTVTDHDSIDAVEVLRRHPDFFLSEEVTCRTPAGTEFHMGVYGIDERDHIQLQRRRCDLDSLLAFLEERGLLFSLNHVFSSLTGPRTAADFEAFERAFPALETVNGQMLEAANRSAAALASRWAKAQIGGSDAHTMASLGRTYTEVPGARTAQEFLAGVRARRSQADGQSGNFLKLTLAVWTIGASMIREHPWTLLLSPFMAAAPLVTFANFLREVSFERNWSRSLGLHAARPAMEPLSEPAS
jgi:predicted metal-dependent phosphoesterase TrpH